MKRRYSSSHLPGFGLIAGICFVVLYLPILLLVVYSFNAGDSIAIWKGFSMKWYASAWRNELVKEVAFRSFHIALFAAFTSTILATLAALGTTRVRPYRGLQMTYAAINQPLLVPEIVTAIALLIFFSIVKVKTGYSGLGYLLAAHTAFCIPFAYLPIRARLESMDVRLEQAAMDLYANRWQVARHVTLPLLWPGIAAGAMLAFVVSLDDVVITELVKSPGQDTLPTYMLGQLRRTVTPEVNAISTVFLAIALVVVVSAALMTIKRKPKS